MALPALQVPPMECPAVLLPTPANLSNMFGGLATFPAKLIALAKTTAQNEAEQYIKQAEDLQDTVDTVRKFFSPYDPKWEKLSIPEKVKMDEYYLKNKSLWLDTKILFMTVFKVFNTEGVSR